MAIMESENPYPDPAALTRDLANLQAILALMQLGANLSVVDEDAVDSITIRLLRWAESNRNPVEIDRYSRLRQTLRARAAPG
ncbi:MAG: hypothetical protein JWR80_5224 [Bradyrhizobium sp.]|nr:hypothetical protein [Bradyrhizobium sp.]